MRTIISKLPKKIQTYVVQLKIESASITNGFTLVVASPQSGVCCFTISARNTTSSVTNL